MKISQLLLTLGISLLISNANAQGMNRAQTGKEAVVEFMETSMGEYGIDSKEMLSYMLPSYMASNQCDNVNMYERIWKYTIEKSQGDFFYVAVFTSPGNRAACILYTFQTQEENGVWYLVPSGVSSYSVSFVLPYAGRLHSDRSDYMPGSGPYEHAGTSIPQVINDSNTGYEAIEGFMETALAKYDIGSEEMFSYMLPSFLANNPCEKVNFWTKVWKYDIEKSQGGFFYVAVFTEPDYKDMCNLITFQTQEENGKWYLVPSEVEYVDVGYLTPWAELTVNNDYVPGSGPYNYAGAPNGAIVQNVQTGTNQDLGSLDDDDDLFDEMCDALLHVWSVEKGNELVKSWDMGFPYNSFKAEMRSQRSLRTNELAQYYLPFNSDHKYLLIVIVNDDNLKPRGKVSYTPQNSNLITEEDFYGTDFPYTTLIFQPIKETEKIDLRGFVDGRDEALSADRLRAFLFKVHN